MSAFDRYAPFVQDYIYRNRWENLRAIQVAAADAIFNTDENVLLTASTASGKTEAAFFPIITLFSEAPPTSVGCIYIGPLKALINDQFTRLTDLCDEADIPVWHWHGDVAQSHKSRLMKRPSGILQITPESLEAMLLHKHAAIPKLFGDLRFVVIDEVHSLLRGDRGGQTLCLIERLSRIAGVNPRRIGLSATIGDPEKTGEFLSLGTGRKTIIPKIEVKGSKWRLSMEHFYVKDVQAAEGKDIQDALPVLQEKTAEAPKNADPGIGYIYEHTRGKKCLVFVNSREECETVTTTLRQYCDIQNERDRFLIHHGNLSASYRETAEGIMKDDSQYMTTVTTATLELGIDIGRLERAFQIDAPWTVSSFLQRMGRTGRRESPPEMWFVMREDEPEARAMLPATIPWKLLQGIALVQLYLEERWCEPPRLDRFAYSLLYHQTMSTLASCGEMSPKALADRILRLHYFRRVSQDDYKILLRHLIKTDHIQQTEQGGLIVGLAGERVVEIHLHVLVVDRHNDTVDAVAVGCHHGQDGARFHDVGVKLAVDFKDVTGQNGHLLGIVRAESVGRFHGHIKSSARFKTFDSLFQRHDHAAGHAEHEAFGIVGIGLVYEFFTVGINLIQIVAEFDIFSWFDFFHNYIRFDFKYQYI